MFESLSESIIVAIIGGIALIFSTVAGGIVGPVVEHFLKKRSGVSIISPPSNNRFRVIISIVLIIVSILIIIVFVLYSKGNPLITYYNFENVDSAWSEIIGEQYNGSDKPISEIVKNDNNGNITPSSSFPGSLSKDISSNYSLTGRKSLHIGASINQPGDFKLITSRTGKFTAEGVTIYALAPNLNNINLHYLQLCAVSNAWACSGATKLVPGEWTPVVLDLRQEDDNNVPFAEQKLVQLVVQCRFTTESKANFDLYLDSAEIFHSGKSK